MEEKESGAGEERGGGAREPDRLLRLAARCPDCGSRPALRISAVAAADAGRHAPGERLGTYQCHRRRCGTVYDLRAAAYQRAE
jgi:hypothetical protein